MKRFSDHAGVYPASHKRPRSASSRILPFPTPSDLGVLYELGPELGRGQFGVIRSCTSRISGAHFACKSISKVRLRTPHDLEEVAREVHIMKHLSNGSPPGGSLTCPRGSIVGLHEVIEDKAFVHLIMELCRGGELFDRIVKKKRYPEAQAAYLLKCLMETVQFCHSMGIMHRDLKPENILLVDDSDTSPIKLADFGLALEFSPGQKFSGMAGSAYYIAPEVLQGEYSEEIDVWSAGVILYVLLSGVPPFWGATEQSIFKAIQEGELDLTCDPWDKISSSAKDLISRMLCPNAKVRLTPAQVLEHPWILHHTEKPQKIKQVVHDHSEDSSIIRDARAGLDPRAMSAVATLSSTSTILVDHENGWKSASQTSTFTTLDNQTLPASEKSKSEKSKAAKPDLNEFLVAFVAGLEEKPLSVSDSLAKIRLEGGWSCTLLTISATEQTLLVDLGQEKYLVAHDRLRKKIGWKMLGQQHFHHRDVKIVSPSLFSFHQSQPVF